MSALRGGSSFAGWLPALLALLLVLTQQGGQIHTLAHELSSARGPLAAQQAAGHVGFVDPSGLASAAARSESLSGPADERDSVDALCVLCVGFANTLATAVVSLAGVLLLCPLGESRPVFRPFWRQWALRFRQPIRGPPAILSIPR